MARIRLARTAETDLEDIWRYSVSTWGLEQAERYTALIERLSTACLTTRISGRHGPMSTRATAPLPVAKHVIFYTVSTDTIDVLGLPHERMDAKRHLAGEEPPKGAEGTPAG